MKTGAQTSRTDRNKIKRNTDWESKSYENIWKSIHEIEKKLTQDASKAASSVLTAVSEGELTPIEATRVMGLIDSYRRTLELTEIEERLQTLETANA